MAARTWNQNRAKISFIFLNPHISVKSTFAWMMCKCTRTKHYELLPGFSEGGKRRINCSCPLCKYMAGMITTELFKLGNIYEEREEAAIE